MRHLFSKNNILVIVCLGLFNFVFLCEEFIFDNIMATLTSESSVVNAQNIILGIGAIGFLGYPLMQKISSWLNRYIVSFVLSAICVVCMLIVLGHQNYISTLVAGIILYILFGIIGAGVCYESSISVTDRKHLAKLVGMSYALGVLLQYLNNNFVSNTLNQTIILIVALIILVILILLMQTNSSDNYEMSSDSTERIYSNHILAAVLLIAGTVLLTTIFTTLDNAVTLVHASGEFNIGQWPRLILAISGLLAGFLFDIRDRRYVSLYMFVIALLATICLIVIEMGGSFVSGLILFYISAGFFVVFFVTSFVDLSYCMKIPSIWAGLGRAINNVCAIALSFVVVWLMNTKSITLILIVSIVVFAGISVLMLLLHELRTGRLYEKKEVSDTLDSIDDTAVLSRLDIFAEHYSLTERDKEVLEALLHSESNVQDIAKDLAMSRAALYRHISAINEKTNTKNRMGLINHYYSWENTK